uniref:2-phospho-L-lactate transferase n=1 Tax=Caldiarchaeum subterraneum TaxID=311458 RepID=A0A7C5L8P3_CALS0
MGGSKLLVGLKHAMKPAAGVAVVNTADDEEFFGLHVSPDVDTVVYSLAGIADYDKGWGVAGDTFNALQMLSRLGCETWFKLGDKDLAIHVYRTMRLREGATLTEVTEEIASRLNAGWRVLPMTDDPVRTLVETESGTMSFQTYFVKHSYGLKVLGVRFEGAENARPTAQVLEALENSKAVVLCPSNPVVSISPILSLQGFRDKLRVFSGTVLAVSPIVGGKTIRGPAAEMMKAVGVEPSSLGVAEMYKDFLDVLVVDEQDAELLDDIAALGVKAISFNTVMGSLEDKVRLAKFCLHVLGMDG